MEKGDESSVMEGKIRLSVQNWSLKMEFSSQIPAFEAFRKNGQISLIYLTLWINNLFTKINLSVFY